MFSINNIKPAFTVIAILIALEGPPIQAAQIFVPKINRGVETLDLTIGDILQLMEDSDERTIGHLERALENKEHRMPRQDLTPQEADAAHLVLEPHVGDPAGDYDQYRRLCETLVGGSNHPGLLQLFGEWGETRSALGPHYRARFKAAEAFHNARLHAYLSRTLGDDKSAVLASRYLSLGYAFERAAEKPKLNWETLSVLIQEGNSLCEGLQRPEEIRRLARVAGLNAARIEKIGRRNGNDQLLELARRYAALAESARTLAETETTRTDLEFLIEDAASLWEEVGRHLQIETTRSAETNQIGDMLISLRVHRLREIEPAEQAGTKREREEPPQVETRRLPILKLRLIRREVEGAPNAYTVVAVPRATQEVFDNDNNAPVEDDPMQVSDEESSSEPGSIDFGLPSSPRFLGNW